MTLKKNIIPRNTANPRICGLPKIHKVGTPIRPIMNTIGSPTYQLVKFLAKTLKWLACQTFSYIKDSSHFVNDIKYIHVDETEIMVSFDVVAI